MAGSGRRSPGIHGLFEAGSVAVVGASDRPGSIGAAILKNVVDAGFKGRIYPVNPRHATVQGRACFVNLRDIGEPVDLAIVATPAAAVPRVLEDCGIAGIRGAVILSGGFGESGDEGRALEHSVVEVAKRYDIRFIGPNCLGIMRPAIGLNATFSQCMAKPGHVALVSQSGAMCTAILDWAAPRDVGFSCVISSGIAADVAFGEILDYLVDDALTKAIMLYVEGIRDTRRFMSALRAAARAKPVVVMKAGRHAEGRRAAISHTAALIGTDDVFDAALRRAGVVRVHRYADFFAAAQTLHMGARTPGPRLAIVTNGGGPGIVAADSLVDKALPLAALSETTLTKLAKLLPRAASRANPVDLLGDAGADRYAAAVRACFEDAGVDAVLAILVPLSVTDPKAVAEAIAPLGASAGKLLLGCWMGEAAVQGGREVFRDLGVPNYGTPEAAIEGFAAVAAYRTNQELLVQIPEPRAIPVLPDREGARMIAESALAQGRQVLDPVESKAVLAAFGVPILRSVPAHDAIEALSIAEEIGFPLVMKIHSPDITHKSDVDGVRLGVRSGREVRSTFHDLVEAARARRPDATIAGVLLEPMHPALHGRELMLGVLDDPVFGPAISIGLGGTMVEIMRDRAVGLPPLNRLLVERMIEGTRADRSLEEFRGWPAANRKALEEVVLRVSDMVCELPWMKELDINPLLVDENGATAVDARVVLRAVGPTEPEYAHMAIHPYPSRLAREHVLNDGTPIMIRPIRPEDAILERDFINGLSERSRYFRFMYVMKEATPDMLSRFTQVDYDREMALVALVGTGRDEKQVAVGRYVDDRDGRGCEFAIAVSDQWQGKGIATELLSRLIGIAKSRRLEYMKGMVLRENRDMIALARNLGFEEEALADEPGAVLVTLRL